jgi:hypothetical protein
VWDLFPIQLTLSTVGLGNGNVLELLHESVGDGHTGELGTTTVGALLRVATKTRDLGEVKVEALNEPVDGVTRTVGEDVDQVVTGELTSRLLGVGKAAAVSGRDPTRWSPTATYNLAEVSGMPRSYQHVSMGLLNRL